MIFFFNFSNSHIYKSIFFLWIRTDLHLSSFSLPPIFKNKILTYSFPSLSHFWQWAALQTFHSPNPTALTVPTVSVVSDGVRCASVPYPFPLSLWKGAFSVLVSPLYRPRPHTDPSPASRWLADNAASGHWAATDAAGVTVSLFARVGAQSFNTKDDVWSHFTPTHTHTHQHFWHVVFWLSVSLWWFFVRSSDLQKTLGHAGPTVPTSVSFF